MTNPDIKKMVDRFLGWKLPKDFAPDCGISFKRESDYEHPVWGRTRFEPIGTNLLSADQAKAMFEYVLADQPQAQPASAAQPDEREAMQLLKDGLARTRAIYTVENRGWVAGAVQGLNVLYDMLARIGEKDGANLARQLIDTSPQDAQPAQKPEGKAAHCMCVACKGGALHASDCAVHNMPAMPNGQCNCGLTEGKAEQHVEPVASQLHAALRSVNAVAIERGDKFGVCDQIDNDGQPYQSQWLADLLAHPPAPQQSPKPREIKRHSDFSVQVVFGSYDEAIVFERSLLAAQEGGEKEGGGKC